MRYLGSSPENLFQRIKRYVREYEAKNGKGTALNIAVGEPDGVPPLGARKEVSEYVLKEENALHTYWDNRDPGEFCRFMIQRIAGFDIAQSPHLSSLVLPGEKSMLGLLLFACGAKVKTDKTSNQGFIKTAPAYDLVGQWSEYIDTECLVWPLDAVENFRLNLEKLPDLKIPPKMIITVKPGNPCPVGASESEWKELIDYCLKQNIRLVNDGAYTSLTHKTHVPLSKVAQNYKDLDWIELFSVSKSLSACGWRVGAAVGSPDFIEELGKIKGNADSGPFGPALVGLEQYFKKEESQDDIISVQKMYERRLEIAFSILEKAGFKKACPTDAGFFMLFHCPHILDGEAVKDAEDFNMKMIEKFGIVGVPFSGHGGEQFIRYSVCSDFEDEVFYKRISEALNLVKISYRI